MRKRRAFILALVLFCVWLFPLVSCGTEEGACTKMERFCREYGLQTPLYGTPAGENAPEDGGEMLSRLYGIDRMRVREYAVIFPGGLDAVSECAVFYARDAADALEILDAVHRRLALLRSVSGTVDVTALDGAFVLRRGNTVVYAVLRDSALARRAWEDILS